ncbi:GTP pyrophosphokinase [uncultured Microbacterium sp.]|uniref:GTP pyrophosphokinase n=1 Tax=uncultured Microbacterium sp. TaxID=191216 RepID=UPI002632FF08|nr:GTP pyrophosphokinase family protein [uncultured Microbacterium sp.]
MTTIEVSEDDISQAKELRDQFQRFLRGYEFGMREVETKISILRDEFLHDHDYNPIEHVTSRLKTPDSIVEKIARKGIEPDFERIRDEITDIAGIRVTCSFVTDVYQLFDLLTAQDDITVRVVKDYIAQPKANGYRSLHAIIEVPVFLSTGQLCIPVEVQFRTIAMDFWASLEHKIHYKFQGQVPGHLVDSLTDAAHAAGELDARMERIHREAHGTRPALPAPIDPRIVEV